MILKDMSELHNDLRVATNKYVPYSVTWELTYNCPNNCIYCYQKKLKSLGNNGIENKYVIDTLKVLSTMGCNSITYSGGDPLVYDGFVNILKETALLGIKINVYSSGLYLNDTLLKIMSEIKIDNVEITILGGTEETNDKLMGKPGAFNQLFTNINKLVKNNINVVLKTTLLKDNIHEFEIMEKISTNLVNKKLLVNTRLLKQYDTESEDISSMGASSKQLRTFYCNNIDNLQPYTRNKITMCEAGVSTVGITPSGNVLPCSMYLGADSFGNITKSSFEDIWNGSIANNFRNRYHKSCIYPQSKCLNCIYNDFCDLCPGIASWNQDICGEFGHMCKVAKIKSECWTDQHKK